MTAIFLIVVLSLLGAMIVSLSTGQQIGQVRDLLGTRALLAARAGVEWGVYRAMQSGSCAASTTLPALSGSASGFAVVVGCSAFGPYDEAASMVTVYQITSTASIGTPGALDRAERQLQALVSVP